MNDKAKPYTIEDTQSPAWRADPLDHERVEATVVRGHNAWNARERLVRHYDSYLQKVDAAETREHLAETQVLMLKEALATSEAARAQAEKERDVARAIADATGHSDLVVQRNRAEAALARVKAELHRWQHGLQVEGDYVCEAMTELDEANVVIERGAVVLRKVEARALAAEAQVMVLREAFWIALRRPEHAEDECGNTWDLDNGPCPCVPHRAALSSPAPSVVRLEEVEALVHEAVARGNDAGGGYGPEGIKFVAEKVLSLWKQKQGGGQ